MFGEVRHADRLPPLSRGPGARKLRGLESVLALWRDSRNGTILERHEDINVSVPHKDTLGVRAEVAGLFWMPHSTVAGTLKSTCKIVRANTHTGHDPQLSSDLALFSPKWSSEECIHLPERLTNHPRRADCGSTPDNKDQAKQRSTPRQASLFAPTWGGAAPPRRCLTRSLGPTLGWFF